MQYTQLPWVCKAYSEYLSVCITAFMATVYTRTAQQTYNNPHTLIEMAGFCDVKKRNKDKSCLIMSKTEPYSNQQKPNGKTNYTAIG